MSIADDSTNKKPKIYLSIPPCHNSNTCCIKFKGENCLVTVLKAAQTQAFIEAEIYISSEKRCCNSHIRSLISKLALQTLHLVSENTRMYRKCI